MRDAENAAVEAKLVEKSANTQEDASTDKFQQALGEVAAAAAAATLRQPEAIGANAAPAEKPFFLDADYDDGGAEQTKNAESEDDQLDAVDGEANIREIAARERARSPPAAAAEAAPAPAAPAPAAAPKAEAAAAAAPSPAPAEATIDVGPILANMIRYLNTLEDVNATANMKIMNTIEEKSEAQQMALAKGYHSLYQHCLLYTSPSPRD